MELKKNEGTIFKNKYKTKENKQPNYRGEINCEGIKKEIALWLRESDNGVKYFYVKLSDPYTRDPQPVGEEAKPVREVNKEGSGDDLPF